MTDTTGTWRPAVTVLGTGYLGATQAACLAELGFGVLGVDLSAAKVARLNQGEAPFLEPGLNPLLRKHVRSGRLRFSTSYQDAARFGDVHFVCVGTPPSRDGWAADTSLVESAFLGVARATRRRCLVVVKSTVPVGTGRRLAGMVDQRADLWSEVEIAANPEFLREGHAVLDTLKPDRLVFGVGSAWSKQLLRTVFQQLVDTGIPTVWTDLATAEMVKSVANSLLATKISFINAMAELCERTGADIAVLADAVGRDPRIGRQFLDAGMGFGGGCLPKDVRAFHAVAADLGADGAAHLLAAVDLINQQARTRTIEHVVDLLDNAPAGRVVAVLGTAFKAGSDDIRASPSIDVATALRELGSVVRVYDPAASANTLAAHPELTVCDDMVDAVTGADVVLIGTEWPQFRALTPNWLAAHVAQRQVVDGRNVLDQAKWVASGWRFRAPGRPSDTCPALLTGAC